MSNREQARALGIDARLIELVSWEPRETSPAEPPGNAEILEAVAVLQAIDSRIHESADSSSAGWRPLRVE